MKSKNRLSYDNYEVIFFKMIEGEYAPKEEKQILKEIENDTFFAFEWSKWKKTQLGHYLGSYTTENERFFEQLKTDISIVSQEPKRKIPIYVWLTTGAAAAVLLFFLMFNPPGADYKTHSELSENPSGKVNRNIRPKTVSPIDSMKSSAPSVSKELATIPIEKGANNLPNQSLQFTNPDQQGLKVPATENPFIESDTTSKLAKNAPIEEHIELPPGDSTLPKVEKSLAKNRFKVTIETERIKRQKYFTMADLRSQGIVFTDLIADKKITLVRENSKLYLRLERDDTEVYYVRMD